MAENEKAGRLEVEVVADTTGFAQQLRAKVSEAAEGVAAKIGVEVDAEGLRARLKTAVETASKGISAKVGVTVDQSALKQAMSNVVAELSSQTVTVPVNIDHSGVKGQVQDATDAAQAEAEKKPVSVPLDPDRVGFLARLRARIAEAQALARATPVNVPVNIKTPRGRTILRASVILSVISLLQPLVAVIGSAVGGLTAMAGAAGQAINVLGAAPGLVALLGQALGGGIIAFKGVGDAASAYASALAKTRSGQKLTAEEQAALDKALSNVAPAAQTAIKGVVGLGEEFKKLRLDVQQSFFSQFADQLKPMLSNLLPVLRTGLKETGTVLGQVTRQFVDFFNTDAFRSDLAGIMASNNRALLPFGEGVRALVQAAVDFVVASGPFIERIGRGVKYLGDWANRAAEAGRASGKINERLQYAGDKFTQLGRIAKAVGSILASVFRAGQDEGDGLLADLERWLTKLAEFAKSDLGQQKIDAWIDATLPGFRELVLLIKDTVAALGRMAADESIAPLLKQLRTELLPALEGLLSTLGSELGPKVIDFLSSLVELLAHLAEGGSGIGIVVDALDTLVDGLNKLVEKYPAIGDALGGLLATFAAYKAFTFVGKKTGIIKLLSLLTGAATLPFKKIAAGLATIFGAGGGQDPGGKPGTKGLGQRVFWQRPMPVYIVGGPGVGGTGGDGPDGKGKGKGEKGGRGKGSRLGRIARGVGRYSGLAALGGLVARGGRGVLGGLGKVGGYLGGLGRRGGPRATARNAVTASAIKGGPLARGVGALSRGRGAVGGFLGGLGGRLKGLNARLGGDAGFLNPKGLKGAPRGLGALAGLGVALKGKGGAALGKFAGVFKGGKPLSAVKSVGKFLGKGGPLGIAASLAGDFAGGKLKDGNRGVRDGAGGALQGAALGAGIGATVGSVVPVVGTAIGAGVGGVIGGAVGFLKNADLPKVLGEVGSSLNTFKGKASEAFSGVKDAIVPKLGEVGAKIGLFKTDSEGKIKGIDLKTPMGYAATGLANALPQPVQDALGNLGLFKTDAQGNVSSIDLFGPARVVGNGLANALPEPVQNALVNLGVFKRDASGAVSVDLAGTATTILSTLAKGLLFALPGPVGAIAWVGGKLRDKIGELDLSGSGGRLMGTLARGIRDAAPIVGGAMGWVASKAAQYWPSSPVKKGPLTSWNKGGAGRRLMGFLADGIRGGSGDVVGAMRGVAGRVDGLTPAGLGAGRGSIDGLLTAQAGGQQVVFEEGAIQVVNPAPEPASESVHTRLSRASAFGLFGQGG